VVPRAQLGGLDHLDGRVNRPLSISLIGMALPGD
jgi:hypothetical protein